MEAAWRMESSMDLGRGREIGWILLLVGSNDRHWAFPSSHGPWDESSNKFRLNFLSWICSLTQYLSRQYLPISELRARHCHDSISWAGASTTCRKCSCARSLLSLFTVSTIFSALLAWQLGWIAAGDVLWLSARTQPRPIRNESSSNVQVGLICGGLQIYLDRDKIISILPNVFFPFQFILRQSEAASINLILIHNVNTRGPRTRA